MINQDKFFEKFRPFYKSKTKKRTLSQEVVDAVSFLLESFESDPLWSDRRYVAYALATIAHETAWTFRPIQEYRARAGTAARRNQDRYWLSGYYGRGYVQLTWKRNYELAARKLSVDLVRNPDLAMDEDIAFDILTLGMHEGWFTGKKLSSFITPTKTDFVNARRIINGTDRATLIAGYAQEFLTMLRFAWEEAVNPVVKKIVDSRPTNGGEWEEEGDSVIQEFDDEGNPLPLADEEPAKEESQDQPSIEQPVDAYPEEPKPGEAAVEEPAKPGEPVVGGRPGDTPENIEPATAVSPSGWSTWITTVRSWWLALGVSTASIGSIFSGAVTNPFWINVLIGVVALALITGILFGMTYLIIRYFNGKERERQAFELTKLKLHYAADPTKYNVEALQPVQVVSAPKQGLVAKLFTGRGD